jgi:S1-C subfamily serine protease
MNRKILFVVLSVSAMLVAPLHAQIRTELFNDEGASAPCVGIDFTGAIRKCAEGLEQAGFIRSEQVGVTGLTLGTDGKDDGAIKHLDPGGAAAQAGLQMGDVIVSVDDKPVPPSASAIAMRMTYGARGTDLHMKVMRNGAPVEIHLVRAAGASPPPPKSPGRFYIFRPVVDWRGMFVPCLGVGPAGPAAIAYCEDHFKPYGFIRTTDYGFTGFHLDPAAATAAITTVDPGSPAATADLHPGDVIDTVEGKPLTASAGQTANMLLFGKAGAVRHVTVMRGTAKQTIALTLGSKK